MTLVALSNALLGDRMVERFHAEPRVQATELLLQERVPRDMATIEPRPLDEMRVAAPIVSIAVRRYRSPHTTFPHTQFLSNGNYVARSRTPVEAPAPAGAFPSPDGVVMPHAIRTASSSTSGTSAAAVCGRPPISRPEPNLMTTR